MHILGVEAIVADLFAIEPANIIEAVLVLQDEAGTVQSRGVLKKPRRQIGIGEFHGAALGVVNTPYEQRVRGLSLGQFAAGQLLNELGVNIKVVFSAVTGRA
jgi:hypothetical protein